MLQFTMINKTLYLKMYSVGRYLSEAQCYSEIIFSDTYGVGRGIAQLNISAITVLLTVEQKTLKILSFVKANAFLRNALFLRRLSRWKVKKVVSPILL